LRKTTRKKATEGSDLICILKKLTKNILTDFNLKMYSKSSKSVLNNKDFLLKG